MTPPPPTPTNRLLAALPPAEYQRLQPMLTPVPLGVKSVLYTPNTPIEHVYFLQHGVASMLAVMADDTLVEVGTIGNEGMVGVPVFLGATQTSGLAFSQVPGEALRMDAAALRAEVTRGGPLVLVLQRYTQALFVMLAQHTACNRLHTIQQRAARWVLMTRDRVPTDEFPLTQEFLGQMLGARRASVNEVMRQFQEAGWLRYRRGVITLLDRAGLEGAVCECYGIVRDEYDRMFVGLSG